MNTLKRYIPRGGFAYNVGLLAGSTAIGQIIGTLGAPLMTRLYTPADFGVLGVFTSAFALLNVISSLRYELAINLAEDDNEAAHLMGLTLLLVVISSLVLLIVTLLWPQTIAGWLNTPEIAPYLWLMSLSLLGAGVYTAFNYWALRMGSFPELGRTRVTQSVSATLISLGLGLVTTGPIGLLVSHSITQSIGSGTLARLSWRRDSVALRGINRSGMARTARRYGRLATLTSVSSLLNTASVQIPRLLLSAFYGSSVIGWFTFSLRIFAVPLTLIGASVGQVFLSSAARLARENPPELRRLFFKTARRLFLLGLLPSGVLMLFGAPLFAFIFGPQWEAAGRYTQILAPAFLIQFVVSSISSVIVILELQHLQLIWDIVRLAFLVIVMVAGKYGSWDADLTVLLYGVVLALTYIFHFLYQWRALNRFVSVPGKTHET